MLATSLEGNVGKTILVPPRPIKEADGAMAYRECSGRFSIFHFPEPIAKNSLIKDFNAEGVA